MYCRPPTTLTAPRGRGKSAALGLSLAAGMYRVLSYGDVKISLMSRSTTETLLSRADNV